MFRLTCRWPPSCPTCWPWRPVPAHPDPAGDGWQVTDATGTLITRDERSPRTASAQEGRSNCAAFNRGPGPAVNGGEPTATRDPAPPPRPADGPACAGGPPLPTDGSTPLQRTEAVLPRPVGLASRVSSTVRAFVGGPASLAADELARRAADGQPPGSQAFEQQGGKHRMLPSDLTVVATRGRLECARAQWRELDHISQLDARITAPRLHSCATIAVVSPKGGVGKTTVTALLGTIFSMLAGIRLSPWTPTRTSAHSAAS